MTTETGTTRRPGRPEADEQQDRREQILVAARELFSAEGFAGTSIRRIAAEAGVNSALVQYYFGGKQGLYEALLDEAIGPLLTSLEELGEGSPDRGLLRELMGRYMHTLADNPWIPPLLIREVLSERGAFRERFLQQFAGRAAPRLARVLSGARQAGTRRADLDLARTALSLMGLMAFPFIGRPIAERVLAVNFGEESLEALIDHQFAVFMDGASGEAAS